MILKINITGKDNFQKIVLIVLKWFILKKFYYSKVDIENGNNLSK